MKTTTQFLVVILLCIPTNSLLLLVNSFYVPSETSLTRNRSRRSDSLSYSYSCSTLFVRKDWFVPDSADDEDKDDDLVTREMFQRDLLEDPQVKRKRKKAGGGGYKPLDNRDHLPFAVKTITPDPYTHPEIKNAKKAKAPKTKKSDLDHQLTASKLYQKKDGKDTSTLLGEFKLDKSTTSGDVIVIGEREFRVETARCQYKYAGGQRFVMVRKILEVKEVSRVVKEDFLLQQYQRSGSETDDPLMLE